VATMLHEPAEGNECTWSLAFVVHGNNEENPKKKQAYDIQGIRITIGNLYSA